jgi:multidrug efflux pump subunit AcrA (membrane-fusion protein)
VKEIKHLLELSTPLKLHRKEVRIILLIIFLILPYLPWTAFTVGQGQVTAINPNERVQALTATVNGFIKKWHIKEGDQVVQGQLVAEIVDNDPGLLDRYQQEKDAAVAALSSAKLMMETSKIDLERQKKLFEQGLSARKDYEKARIEYSKLQVEYSKNIASMTKAETQLSRQSTQSVLSPANGTITRILPGERGVLIKSGTPIAIFAPDIKTPSVEVWIDGNDAALVKKDQTAMVQFEGWPSVQIPGWPSLAIGAFKGRVHLIDQASSYKGKFRVLVVPAEEWPSQNVLRLGSHGKAYIHLNQNILGWEVWRQLNGFPAFFEPIEDELNALLKGSEK